ncbi:hypothetical protein M5K25_024068 [Dendrobium thyrsiflorum]|uniref:Uncharacterized protein n=1 Tax=Dendrobium thyrsiflorum TaxID=117978 RepID=A0ABD0U0W6_DENTH
MGVANPLYAALPVVVSCVINEVVVVDHEPNHCLVNLVASPIVSQGSIEDVSDDERADPVDRDLVSPAGGISPVESGEMANALVTPAQFSPLLHDSVDVYVPLVDVPISVISSDALLAQLVCKLRTKEVLNDDWIEDGISSTDGEEMNGKELESRDNFDLSILQIDDAGFFKKSGKHRKQKSKKK